MITIKRYTLALSITIIIFNSAIFAANFPQRIVDIVCADEIDKRDVLLAAVSDYRNKTAHITNSRQFSIPETFTLTDLVVGPDADTILFDTDYVQNGNVYVLGDGVLIIDGAYFSVAGQIAANGNGKIYVRDGATLHFNQLWVGQYSLWLFEHSYFEATDATIDANNVMHFVETHDSATYIARRCYYPDWTFKKFFGRSSVIMEDVAHIGDMMVGDSTNIHLIRCDTLMPWFQAPNGSVIDIEFPDPDSVEHFEFSSRIAGIDGIGETFIVDSCARCWWSFETYPGCSVIVRNSEIRGCAQRIPGVDTFSIYGIRNYNYNTDLIVPLSDRHLEFISTYNYWWNWYPWENTVFFIDSCMFGEMICSNSATVFATRCIHDGSTITLATKDSSFMSFEAGTSYAFAGSFQQSTLLMKDAYITPLWPYQTTNIAHHNSRFLCVNCDFDSLPFALDTALVMWVAIETMDSIEAGGIIPIIGSAWIDAGPENSTTFDLYRLFWSSADSLDWRVIADSSCEIFEDTLGMWNTIALDEGNYILRLTILDSHGDSLTAFRNVILSAVGIPDESEIPRDININAYPNPFNSSCVISDVPEGAKVSIYDLRGNVVYAHDVGVQNSEPLQNTTSTFIWTPDETIASGIYVVRARLGTTHITKRIVYIR